MKAKHLKVMESMFRGCDDKRWFATEHEAVGAQAKRLGHRVYKCKHCNGWHTASRSK